MSEKDSLVQRRVAGRDDEVVKKRRVCRQSGACMTAGLRGRGGIFNRGLERVQLLES